MDAKVDATNLLEEELKVCKQKLEDACVRNEELQKTIQILSNETNTSSSTGLQGGENVVMSDEVSSANRYSRLMALQKMGVVADYAKILNCSVTIVGVGGIGIVAAEMLTRCGIGELTLVDNDHVELANMNRMFYRPSHCGLTKVEAAVQTLTAINPDVKLRSYNLDVTHLDSYSTLLALLHGKKQLLLCCVDNFTARMSVNQLCLEAKTPWLESGLSENAVSGHIQFMIPGLTACFSCAPPLVVATGLEASLKKEGVCVASLPTTSAIIAGLLVQNALKYLLEFGQCSELLAYNSIQDFFSSYSLKPNPQCTSKFCLQTQREVLENGKLDELSRIFQMKSEEPIEKCTETANEWNIELVEEVQEKVSTVDNTIVTGGMDELTNEQLSNMLKNL